MFIFFLIYLSINSDDVERSIKGLKDLGDGFALIQCGGKTLVQSVPCELSADHTMVLGTAQARGYVTYTTLRNELNWDNTRIENTIEFLIRNGMAWVDAQDPSGETSYWFPSLANISLDSSELNA